MDDEKLRPIVPPGTHLAWSRTNSGRKRALLFDNGTNALIGPAELEAVEDDDGSSDYEDAPNDDGISDEEAMAATIVLALAVTVAVAVLTTIVVKKGVPRLKRWWTLRVMPSMKDRWARIVRRQRTKGNEASTELAMMHLDPRPNLDAAVESAIEEHRESMSSEEAQKRLLAMFLAAGLIAEQIRALQNVRIEDADVVAVKAAMEKLAARDVTDDISLMLEINPRLLDRETLPEFVRLFGGGQIVDDVYRPLSHEDATEALRLSAGEEDGTEGDTGALSVR